MTAIKKFWRSLGSGMITGASDNDPGGIATYSIAGAQNGYSSLWVLLFILPFMIAIQEMSARIGALSGCGLAGNIKKYYPGWLLAIAAGSILIANIFNIGADIYGMAGAVNLLVPVQTEVLAVSLSVAVLLITILLPYHKIVKIFKWLSITLLAYIFAFLSVKADWGAIIKNTFIPTIHLNREYLTVLFAILGTTISPYLYFWQASEEAEETKLNHPQIRICRFRTVRSHTLEKIEWDTKIGMAFSNVISFFIIALTATTLFKAGAGNIETLRQAAQALEPIAGQYAYILFTVGLLGSGLLAIPVLAGSAGYVLAELFGWKGSLNNTFGQARQFYIAISAAIALGLFIPFLGITPVKALFYSAIINGLISPLLIFMILHMARNPAIVGPNITRRSIHILGNASFILMTVGAVAVLFS